jgi:hypothetical protein
LHGDVGWLFGGLLAAFMLNMPAPRLIGRSLTSRQNIMVTMTIFILTGMRKYDYNKFNINQGETKWKNSLSINGRR